MATIIRFNAEGVEVERSEKGKGRPPRGAVKQANGDFHVHPIAPARFIPEYITVGLDGEVLSRKVKGQGRPALGYVKQVDGPYAGHWILSSTPVVKTVTVTEAIQEEQAKNDGFVPPLGVATTVA